MWDPSTNRVHTSRDVIWLKRMFFVNNKCSTEATTHADEIMEVGEDNDNETSDTLTDAIDIDEEEATVLVKRVSWKTDKADDLAEIIEGNDDIDDDIDGEQLDEVEPENEPETTTRSGRISRAPSYLKDYAVMALTKAEFGYYTDLRSMVTSEICNEDLAIDYEMAAVGAGLGGGFGNTRELKVMKYKEAMKDDPVN